MAGLRLLTVRTDDRQILAISGIDPQFRNRYSANSRLFSLAISSAGYRNGIRANCSVIEDVMMSDLARELRVNIHGKH